MKKAILIAVILAFSFQAKAQKKVNWLSFEEAIEINKTNQKPFLIFVYTNWCGYCKKMRRETFSDTYISNYINKNFHAVQLNAETKKDIIYNDYTFKYKENGRRGYHELAAGLLNSKLSYPTTVFMNEEQKIINRIPGFLEKDIYETILSYINTKAYKDKEWKDFQMSYKRKN